MKQSFLAILLLFSLSLIAQPKYQLLSSFLRKHVSSSGKVNYLGIQKDKAELERILKSLSTFSPDSRWKKSEELAYWINMYNGYTLLLICEHYPLKSIMELDGGKTWDVQRVPAGRMKLSLNQIENEILRAKFKDPRIHFALNCGAKSCPPLLNEAYFPKKIEQQLEKQTRLFIRSSKNVVSEKSVRVSKIFEWYGKDFIETNRQGQPGAEKQGILSFLIKYSGVHIASEANISFLEYDWSLNN